MSKATASLARSITWAGSKQSYLTARLLVDRDLIDDCFRAYAYFRWADDVVDVSSQSIEEAVAFITRQRALIDSLYKGGRPPALAPQEELIADLISHDRGENSGLQSFIRGFLAALEFDAQRRGRLISQQELDWYSSCLGRSVTDAIQYFIGNGHTYAATGNRYLAATAAHMTHMLRDMVEDMADGFLNVPCEYLGIPDASEMNEMSPPSRDWVKGRVDLARQYFVEGKAYLDELDLLRCKIAGYWYCVRFESVLDAIERDDYVLRLHYTEGRSLFGIFKLARITVPVTLRHIVRRFQGQRNQPDRTQLITNDRSGFL